MRNQASLTALLAALGVLVSGAWSSSAQAAPPTPSGPHPRLFMGADQIAGYTANASMSGTAAAALVHACDDTFDNVDYYSMRGGSDGDNWPGSAVRCAFAFLATGNDTYRTQAIKFWRASLDDDQQIGDGLGCVAGVSTNWQSWDGSAPAPAVIRTIAHDTGYPIRWYGPAMALVYDWLHDANGVDAALLDQTRVCLSTWVDYYSDRGYHNDEAGANYNAGFVIAKALAAVAIGTDGGADGHLWSETTDQLFPDLLVGQGLAGANNTVGQPAGVLVGGDWPEGWQYGPLSVLEYAVAARALVEHGAPQPELSDWTNSLAVRAIYGTVPDKSGQWVGGDFDSDTVYAPMAVNILDAVLAGPSSDTAASYAAGVKQGMGAGIYVYNALAELRSVTPVDFATQNPAPSRWYVARGTRAMYARSSWAPDALWATFTSAPSQISDHLHYTASNFVFSRGADHLVVDVSNYGEPSTLASNAVTADSTVAQDDYFMTQTPWSQAELLWARGTDDAVYAARSDFAKAFIFSDTPSDIPYAHREWVMLPEGEIVTIDRVHTADAAHAMYVGFHTNTVPGGGLSLDGAVASGTVGASKLAIHAVALSGGTPEIQHPEVGDCSLSCNFPCGACDAARIPVDKYAVKVPGPQARAIHVIDALSSSEAAAIVGSINDDVYDPAPKQNADVIGAAVYRAQHQTYVVASSADDGASPTTMVYGVPGDGPSRHIVFDAPEASDGSSTVSTSVSNGRCVISISAGPGFPGRPLMFKVANAADGCTATAATDVGPGEPPHGGAGGTGGTAGTAGSAGSAGTAGTGGAGAAGSAGSAGSSGASGSGGAAGSAGSASGSAGATGNSAAPGATNDDSGCGCRVAAESSSRGASWAGLALALVAVLRRTRASRQEEG